MADSMTDEQLVAELQRYGETVAMPIKANKRPLLMKKLNHLRSRNRPPVQKGKSKSTVNRHELGLGSFSSDNSDAESDHNTEVSQLTSINIGSRPTLQASVSNTVTDVVNKSLRRRSRLSPMSVNVRGRKSDIHIDGSPGTSASGRSRSFTSAADSMLQQTQTRRRSAPPEPEEDTQGSDANTSQRLYQDLSTTNSQGETSYRNNQSTMPSFESSDSDIDDSLYEVENRSVNTSFGLSQSGRRSVSNHVSPNRSPGRSPIDNKSNHTVNSSSSLFGKFRRRRLYPEHVSFGLVALGLAFFVVIFVCYMVVRKELFIGLFTYDSSLQAKTQKLLQCEGDSKTARTGKCYQTEEVHNARDIISDLLTDLASRKGKVLCGYIAESEQREMVNTWKKKVEKRVSSIKQDSSLQDVGRLFNCCVDLIIANPSWNIIAFTEQGDLAQNVSDVHYFESSVASLGLYCRLRRSFSRVMWSLFVLVAGVVSLGVVLVMLWWRIKAKERDEQQVFAMVEQIIDLLREQHDLFLNEDTEEQAGMAVQHVRDQLLPPARRKALKPIWDKAVKFIEANESRVRLETQVIEGEEFAVWRWIQTVPNGGKVWQGQAFGEHNDNNASPAMFSPTPFLKIRNMFDKEIESDEKWEENVKDALLEKCQNVNSLLHIFVDKSSREGCVYVKCSSKETAGEVKQALHGWWFDGRLVTVKHVKMDQYHKRWPEAKLARLPLVPSTNQMRSLAQPYHRSSLEMT